MIIILIIALILYVIGECVRDKRLEDRITEIEESQNTSWHEIDSIAIYGSNDNVRWEFIDVQPLSETVDFPNSKPFKYYRFEINRNGDKEC